MKVGDLVCWRDKPSLVGIVLEATAPEAAWDVQGLCVQWSNGVTSNHSSEWVTLVETSENT